MNFSIAKSMEGNYDEKTLYDTMHKRYRGNLH